MEKLNETLDFVEFENNLPELDDDQLDYLLHIYQGEKCYRKWRKAIIKELSVRIVEQTTFVDWEEDERDD